MMSRFRSQPGESRFVNASGKFSGLWLGLFALSVWLAMPDRASAQTPPISIDLERVYSIRSEGPITLRVRLTPTNAKLVTGRLEFRLLSGNEILSTLISGDEFINPPAKTGRYVLPSPDVVSYDPQLDVVATFVTEHGRYKFDPIPIIVPRYRERDLVVGVVQPANKSESAEIDLLSKALKLENFTPMDANNRPIDITLRTNVSNFAPEQLPPDPTSYSGFNILMIPAEGFAALRESQWPAILDWVDAGGSLCLLPGTGLTDQHISALNKLVAHRSEKVTFLLGANSDVVLKDDTTDSRSVLLRRGLGQIAIVPLLTGNPIDPNSTTWRRVAAHLWKMRSDQAASVLTTGRWSEQILTQQDTVARSTRPQYDYYRSAPDQQRRLGAIPISSGDPLVQAIMPSDLRIIPLSLIAFILFLYVLAIGPADYLILGRLKMRKWTWVTFPVTTVLFAGGALWMAEWYMNTGDARRSVYLVDIGVEGNPERINQFEMLFNSRQRIVETPVKGGLFTPLNHQEYGANSFQTFNRPGGMGGATGVSTPELTGRIPSHFVAKQLTPKWVPQLNRITTLLPSAPVKEESDPTNQDSRSAEENRSVVDDTERPWLHPKIDWQKFQRNAPTNWEEWNDLMKNQEWRTSLVDPIRAVFPASDLIIGVGTGGKFVVLHGSNPVFRPIDRSSMYGGRYSAQRVVEEQTGLFTEASSNFVSEVSMPQDGGLFGVISSMAPHGGRQLEDLSLLDPSDPQQWMLVVGTNDGGNWIVYRKLFARIE